MDWLTCVLEVGKNIPHLTAYVLRQALEKKVENTDLLNLILQHSIDYVPIKRSDQRIEMNVVRRICTYELLDTSVTWKRQMCDDFIRLYTTNIICDNPKTIEILYAAYQELSLKHQEKGYFAHSQTHYKKNRMLQIIVNCANEEIYSNNEQILSYLINDLVKVNNQLSVIFYTIWIITDMYNYPNMEDIVFDSIFEATTELNGNSKNNLKFLMKLIEICIKYFEIDTKCQIHCFSEIMPYAMCSNDETRRSAQSTLITCYEKMASKRTDFDLFIDALKLNTSRDDNKPNCKTEELSKLLEILDISEDRTSAMIFNELGEVLHSADDAVAMPVLNYFYSGTSKETPLRNYCRQFKLNGQVENTNEKNICLKSDEDVLQSNFQQKITPWEYETSRSRNTNHENREGLVLVASLIERATNLGGLSRTCEIFGVSELVINSIKHLEKQEFKNLSVSSEKWISISEVKRLNLGDFLKSKKAQGYVIVGLEQTRDSALIHKFAFPEKVVLMLGNERTGIPADLLHLLDICLEIPQQGIIRSLNVHVSGALCVWEYFKQQNLRKTEI